MLQKPINQPSQQPKTIEDDAKKRQRGTGFTNISKVLGSNIGAGQKMGQAISGQLGQQAEQIRKGIEQGQSQFQAGLQKEQQKQAETLGAATGALGSMMNQQQPSNMPNYEQIGENLKNLQYLGPKSIENIEQQQQRASNLAALGRLSGLSGGQQQLLRTQVAGRGRYGLGQSSLDSLLLGKEGQKQLQSARAQTAATETQAQQAEKMAQAEAQSAEMAGEQRKLDVYRDIDRRMAGITEAGEEAAKSYYSNAKTAQEALKKLSKIDDLKNADLTPEEKRVLQNIEEFGISGNVKIDSSEKDLLKNLLQNISSKGETTYTGQKRFSDEQEKSLQNLAKLASLSPKKYDKFQTNLFKQDEDAIKSYDAYKGMEAKTKAELDNLDYINRTLDSKEKNTAGYVQNAKNILGNDVVKRIERDVHNQHGGLFGATAKWMQGEVRNRIEPLLRQKQAAAQGTIQSRDKQKMTLQDYLNKASNKMYTAGDVIPVRKTLTQK